MRGIKIPIFSALTILLGALLINSSAAAAAPNAVAVAPAVKGIDLSITGSVVAGVTAAQSNQKVVFAFAARNNSPSKTAPEIAIQMTVANGTPSNGGYICPLIDTHLDINADGSYCEVGGLTPGQTARTGLVVNTPNAPGSMIVTGCISNQQGTIDPVPSNNCTSITVKIE